MTVTITLLLLKCLSVVNLVNIDIVGYTVSEEYSNVTDFPHSVFVKVRCGRGHWSCGASILNQALLLTAAHCFRGCDKAFDIKAYTASEHKAWGSENNVTSFKIHEKYAPFKGYDIAVMRLEKELILGKKVKRIIIMKKRLKYKSAVVAGWGGIDTLFKRRALKYARQQILSQAECAQIKKTLPAGTICGINLNNYYPKKGDSGNALVVNGSTQIGIVSYSKISKGITIYTDVSHYYDWIVKTAKDLYQGYKEEATN